MTMHLKDTHLKMVARAASLPSCCRLMMILLLLLEIATTVNAMGEEYLYPTHYWPFGRSKWMVEVMEAKNPTVHNRAQLTIVGPEDGYLKFPLQTASAILGSYDEECVVEPSDCTAGGLTLAFWVKISEEVGGTGSFQLLSLVRTDTKARLFEFGYDVNKGVLSINAKLSTNIVEKTPNLPVTIGQWYHIMVKVDKLGMDFFINNQIQPTNKHNNKDTLKYTKHTQKVNFVLGQYPNIPTQERAFAKAFVGMDNLAMWTKVLTREQLTRIYSAEFGDLSIKSCNVTRDGRYKVTWNNPKDYYKHATTSIMNWFPQNTNSAHSATIQRNPKDGSSQEALMDAFQANTTYKITLQVAYVGGYKLSADMVCAPVSENKYFYLHSDSPSTIMLKWGAPTKKNYKYKVFVNTLELQEINAHRLVYRVQKLKPNEEYNITLIRENKRTGSVMTYQQNLKTMGLATAYNTSVQNVELQNNSWNKASFLITFHPELIKQNMVYVITTKKLYKNDLREQRGSWGKPGKSALMYTILHLDENTWYQLDVELRDKNSTVQGPKLLKPFIWKTQEKFPPMLNLTAIAVEATSMTLKIDLSEEIKNNKAARFIQLFVRSLSSKDDFKTFTHVAPISNVLPKQQISTVQLTKLSQHTVYKVSAAVGDGTFFGNRTKEITLETKAYFQQPSNLTILNVTDDSITIAIRMNLPAELSPNNDKGIPIEVVVRVRSANFSKNLYQTFKAEEPKNMTVTGLQPSTMYKVSVRTGAEKLVGDFSDPITVTTEQVRFEPPTSVKILNKTATSILLDINLSSYVTNRPDYITHVIVYARSNQMTSKATIFVNETKGILLKDLHPNSMHTISAATGNGTVFGKILNFVVARTLDFDECAANSSICDEHAKCVNTVGSYTCLCLEGFIKTDGNYCTDVNECEIDSMCGEHAKCINTAGSYKCQCLDGFKKADKGCVVKELDVASCGFETLNNITWLPTAVNRTVKQNCSQGYEGQISRECVLDDVVGKGKWMEPKQSNCVNVALTRMMQANNEKPEVIAATLNNFVRGEKQMTSGDVGAIVDLMGNLMTGNSADEKFTENMIDITSELLQENTIDAWKELPEEKRSQNAGRLLNTADTVVEASANVMQGNETTKEIKTDNIVMKLKRVPHSENEESIVLGESVQIPRDALSSEDGSPVTVALVTYDGMADILGVPRDTTLRRKSLSSLNLTLNSEVTAVSIFPTSKKLTFDKPVLIVQQFEQTLENDTMEPNCVYWESSDEQNGVGYWSDEGCYVDSYNKSHVTCKCYHLTNFAILMSVTGAAKDLSEADVFALSMITMIGLSVSLVSLMASFLTFMLIRTIRSLRNTIHRHLVVALFFANFIFLFGINRTGHKIGCQVIAASLHYFFMVAFFIMGLEGLVLYLMLVRVYRSMGTSGYGSPKFIALCWVLPIIVIVVNLFIDQNAYGDIHGACWLSMENGFIWSFVGPVTLVIGVNLIILVMTLKVMSDKAKRRTSNVDEIWFWTKGCCLLLSILGVTWLFGVFFVNSNTVFMAYIFTGVNSLQGLSIFIFHCMCDPRVRKAYHDFFCCVDIRRKHQQLTRTTSRSRTTSSGSKASYKRKYKMHKTNGKESLPLYSNGSSSPDNSFGVLVGTNNF